MSQLEDMTDLTQGDERIIMHVLFNLNVMHVPHAMYNNISLYKK